MGKNRSDNLSSFLESQNLDPAGSALQQPFYLPTSWLHVGHLDEIFAFIGNADEVVIADPGYAYELQNDKKRILEENRGQAVFFATGATTESGKASTDGTLQGIKTGVNHTGKSWKYIRIYTGDAAGQVAEIKKLGNGYLVIGRVWDTGSKILKGGGKRHITAYILPKELPTQALNKDGEWFRVPKKGDKYVLVEGTKKWANGTPAMVTVAEILDDSDLADLNKDLHAKQPPQKDAQELIEDVKKGLEEAAGGKGRLKFVSVPVIYVGLLIDFEAGESATALNPGLMNLQVINNKLYFPRQFGPLDSNGKDIFEQETLKKLPNARFVDDWDLYHVNTGEVHCGTATKRKLPDFNWWEKKP